MVKKVVALETCGANKITEGKGYKVLFGSRECYYIINDVGDERGVFKSRFKPLEEEMEIKVGSEWVSKNGCIWIVKYVNKYVVLNKDKMEICVGIDKFKETYKPLEEEMEIKVGSEWVLKLCEKRKCKVLYVGKQSLFGEWNDGTEGKYDIENFLDKYKPAPIRRTVWLNVHSNFVQCHKDKKTADENALPGFLFQQEVELIDPREGEKDDWIY